MARLLLATIDRRSVMSKTELVAEVNAAHIGIFHDLVRPAFGEHPAGVNDVGAVDQTEGLADIVVGAGGVRPF